MPCDYNISQSFAAFRRFILHGCIHFNWEIWVLEHFKFILPLSPVNSNCIYICIVSRQKNTYICFLDGWQSFDKRSTSKYATEPWGILKFTPSPGCTWTPRVFPALTSGRRAQWERATKSWRVTYTGNVSRCQFDSLWEFSALISSPLF